MSSIMEDFDHLKIEMEDIRSATCNFSQDKRIGGGGFGPVYKGELSHPTGPKMVAYKRLDRRFGQGNTEFWKEIMMLSKYKHENLISLLHFSIEGDERVLVYEYAPRGSLDCYLGDASLTWNQRLHICIGVARALNYLHNPTDAQQRLLHRDIKSSNILLDENWSSKVSDFGLSKIGPVNQAQTYLVSTPVGTIGYCDPLYWELGFLSKESDIYSFGVVLFEVMSGRLCCEYDSNNDLIGILVPKWKKCYDEDKLDDIIFQDIKEQIVLDSLLTFSAIAKRCLNRDRKDRPTMKEIMIALEDALHIQEDIACDIDFLKISKIAVPPLPYKSRKELSSHLYKGILVDEGKRWIWINQNKQINEMISARQCFSGEKLHYNYPYESSRFSKVVFYYGGLGCGKVKMSTGNVSPQFMSTATTYNVNLLLYVSINFGGYPSPEEFDVKYKLNEETDYRHSFLSPVRENGWGVVQLYQVTNTKKEYNFTIELNVVNHPKDIIEFYFEGIEFRPM